MNPADRPWFLAWLSVSAGLAYIGAVIGALWIADQIGDSPIFRTGALLVTGSVTLAVLAGLFRLLDLDRFISEGD